MKQKRSCIFKFSVAFAFWGVFSLPVLAVEPLFSDVQTAVMRVAINETAKADATVNLTLQWTKQSRVSDYTHRSRLRGFPDVVVSEKQDYDNACKGVLLLGEKSVVAPAICFQRDWKLTALKIHFSNGEEMEITSPAEQVRLQDELAFITLPRTAQGVFGAEILYIPKGSGLQHTFAEMTQVLSRFFAEYGIYKKPLRGSTRVPHKHTFGKSYATLTVGEAIFYQGKLAALVKQVPHDLGPFWINGTGISEKALITFNS